MRYTKLRGRARRGLPVVACAATLMLAGVAPAWAVPAPTFARVDYVTNTQPVAVAVGDLDGDAKPDLAVADTGANRVSVLLGNGDGTFQAKVDYATGTSPRSVAVGDLNADGKPDLALANNMSSTVSVLIGNGNGTF